MSRTKKITKPPMLPTLPIEIWFEPSPRYAWFMVEEDDDYVFQCRELVCDGSDPPHNRPIPGTVYLAAFLAIDEPQQLVPFLNTYDWPWSFEVDVWTSSDPAPPRWSTFIEAQEKLKQAMRFPISKLRRHAEIGELFQRYNFQVMAEWRDGAYYGIINMEPGLNACYRLIAKQRLLGNVEYGFCIRCGKHFTVTSGHKRKYCSTDCAHAAASQTYRENQKRKRL